MKVMRRSHPRMKKATAKNPSRRVNELVARIQNYKNLLAEQNVQLDQTRAELRYSSVRYDELYELSPIGFLTLDRRGCITVSRN
jgi:hypothetical protein